MKNEKGMTLIEIIIAIAIIGMIAISLLALYSTAFAFIMRAGDTTDAAFRTHAQIETTLRLKDSDPSPTNLTLTYSNGDVIISKGNKESISQTVKDTEVIIHFFQPKY